MKNGMFKTALMYGLILAAIFIMIDLLFYTFSFLRGNMFMQFFMLLINIGILILILSASGRAYRKNFTNGYINYGKAYLVCLYTSIVYMIIILIYSALFYFVIDKSRAEAELQMALQMMESFSIPEEARDEVYSSMAEKFTPTRLVLQSFVSNLITTALISLIAALFVRKKEKFAEIY